MIALTLSSEAEKLLASVETFPARVANAIATALQQQNELTLRHVRSARLSGRGPFPPEAGRLGERSGRLRQSLHLTDVRVGDTAIEASLAADVPYAGVHEYGFAGSVGVRSYTRRGRKGGVNVRAHQRQVVFPERAPIRRGMEDRAPDYAAAVSKAVVEAWNQ